MSLASCQTAPPRDRERSCYKPIPGLSRIARDASGTSARGAIDRRRRVRDREDHAERRAGTRRALDLDAAPGRGDDPVPDRQTEARPPTDVLRREERLEDAAEALRRNA